MSHKDEKSGSGYGSGYGYGYGNGYGYGYGNGKDTKERGTDAPKASSPSQPPTNQER